MTERDKPSDFTGVEIAAAEKRFDFSHPVIEVILAMYREIEEAENDYSGIMDHHFREKYVKEHYGFLADAMAQAGPFTLEPLDIVSLWAFITDTFPTDSQRVAVAGMVASAYAIQGVENAAWEQFPKSFLEYDTVPDEVKKNTDEREQIIRHLDRLQTNLNVLMPSHIVDLTNQQSKDLLDEIQDNFGAVLLPLHAALKIAG